MTEKRTPWFNGNVQPARIGVYERQYPCGVYYNYWDGRYWHLGVRVPHMAAQQLRSSCQLLSWRGLAQEPKGVNR